MQKAHQDILIQLRDPIINEINVQNHIISTLKSSYILNDDKISIIGTGKTNKEKAELLLDILPKCGPYAFSYFLQALRYQYGWMADHIDQLLISSGSKSEETACNYSNIPSISPLTVVREEKEKELKNALKSLIPKGYLVLHGMKGFGKSCLTVNVLNDIKLVSALFNNEIYWLEFGKHRPVEEDIWMQMNNLYHQITKTNYPPEAVTSSHAKETIRLSIQNHFRQNVHKEALLILDDVTCKEIIETFSFDCKILVITPDISVLQHKHLINIELNSGFTKTETLQLFAQVLNMEVDKLPKEATLIYEECKGTPLLITMLATQFKDFKHAMQCDNQRWRHYLNCIKSKDLKHNIISEFMQKQEAIFKMSIDQLPEDMKEHYMTLAIFNKDINIMPKTLEILWNKESSFQVEEIMLEFFNKSLVVKQWNLELKSYIYGVHDHVLEYLHKVIPKNELMNMHRSFIEKYRKYGDGTLSKLPDDNYSYTYIGYHLELAEMTEEFPELYLNFDFLQAKIYHTGLSDLLIDLDKYRPFITRNNDPELESQVQDLEMFLQTHTNVLAKQRNRQHLDLIQIAMNNPVDGWVRNTARKLALKRFSNLYLSLESKINHADNCFSEEVPMNARVARFTDNLNEILLGDEHGGILLWNCATRKSKYFYGYDRKSVIKKIVISNDGQQFLSLSEDGVVKLFEIDEQDYLSPNSPRQRQSKWYSLFNEEDDSKISISVDDDTITDVCFGKTDDIIVTCTYKGLIEIWHKNGKKIFKEITRLGHSEKRVMLTNNYHLLHCVDLKEGILEVYALNDDTYDYASKFNLRQKNMKVIYMAKYDESFLGNASMIIVTEKTVSYLRWYYSQGQIHSYDIKPCNISSDQPNDKKSSIVYKCATLTYDEKYLILADSDGNVTVMKHVMNPVITYKAYVSSLDTYWMKYEKYHLICGCENRIIHMWKLDIDKESAVVTKPSVYAIMKDGDAEDVIVTETIIGTLVVLSNEKVMYEIPYVEGKIAKLFLIENDRIVYVTEKKKKVTIVDCQTHLHRAYFSIANTDDLLTVIELDQRNAIICQDNENDLRVMYEKCKTGENTQGAITFVKNVGSVFEMFQLSANVLLTVNKNGRIKFWYVKGTNWKEIGAYDCDIGESKVTYSCLSRDNEFLAIVQDYLKVTMFFIENEEIEQNGTEPNYCYCIKEKTEVYKCDDQDTDSTKKVKCCEFSWDKKYLAVGMSNGLISVIDLANNLETKMLDYHKNPIEQLHWAPESIGLPILSSITGTEMAFWNLSLSKFKRTVHRQSRMGCMSSSNSSPNVSISPRSSLIMRGSQSVDFAKLSLSLPQSECQPNSNGSVSNGTTIDPKKTFWLSKTGKDSKHPELLGIVPLPTICTTKVYVSNDFIKFLTIDVHGSITKYKLFQK